MMAKTYYAGEIFNYEWQEHQVLELIDLWDKGNRKATELAEHFKRHQCEIAILVMDLGERGFLTLEGKTKRKNIFAEDRMYLIREGKVEAARV